MNRGLEAMGAKVVKHYRLYERLLEEEAEPSAPPLSKDRSEPQD
jgi:hypothetical protein